MAPYVFMGSPPLAATILAKLCEKLPPPALVVTQLAKPQGRGMAVQPTAVEAWARGKGLPVLATGDVNAPESLEALRRAAPGLVLVAAFGQILREPVLQLPKHCLNVHASLLPRWRGAAPVQRAIWEGDPTTGVAIQKMAKKLDTGDVLVLRETPIGAEETSGELLDRLAALGGEALVEAVRLIESGQAKFTPQDEAKATYAKKIDKSDAAIDWTQGAERIERQIRALQPWPVAETGFGGDRVKIFRARSVPGTAGATPGSIASDGKTELRVACGDGRALSLTSLQLANRKRLDIKDFLMAYRGTFPHNRVS